MTGISVGLTAATVITAGGNIGPSDTKETEGHSSYLEDRIKNDKLNKDAELYLEEANRQLEETFPIDTINPKQKITPRLSTDEPETIYKTIERYDDGSLKKASTNTGIERHWHENKQLSYEFLTFPTCVEREYYPSGQIKTESHNKGRTFRRWYENGYLQQEIYPDKHSLKIEKEWYENGNPKSAKYPDGKEQYWTIDGKPFNGIFFKHHKDGETVSHRMVLRRGRVVKFQHFDTNGKEDTKNYLQKKQILKTMAQQNVSKEKGTITPKRTKMQKLIQTLKIKSR